MTMRSKLLAINSTAYIIKILSCSSKMKIKHKLPLSTYIMLVEIPLVKWIPAMLWGCTVVMPMFVSSKWQRVALPTRWRASVRALFFCYLTFLDHRTNISRKVRARQHVGSAKQVSKLSLGQNKHGQNITTPLFDAKK